MKKDPLMKYGVHLQNADEDQQIQYFDEDGGYISKKQREYHEEFFEDHLGDDEL